MKYKPGENLSNKGDKKAIEESKDRLIKLAEAEIKKWQLFLKRLKND